MVGATPPPNKNSQFSGDWRSTVTKNIKKIQIIKEKSQSSSATLSHSNYFAVISAILHVVFWNGWMEDCNSLQLCVCVQVSVIGSVPFVCCRRREATNCGGPALYFTCWNKHWSYHRAASGGRSRPVPPLSAWAPRNLSSLESDLLRSTCSAHASPERPSSQLQWQGTAPMLPFVARSCGQDSKVEISSRSAARSRFCVFWFCYWIKGCECDG